MEKIDGEREVKGREREEGRGWERENLEGEGGRR